jgi:hypothetical protein
MWNTMFHFKEPSDPQKSGLNGCKTSEYADGNDDYDLQCFYYISIGAQHAYVVESSMQLYVCTTSLLLLIRCMLHN